MSVLLETVSFDDLSGRLTCMIPELSQNHATIGSPRKLAICMRYCVDSLESSSNDRSLM